ncbi:MAG: hypothetical protein ACKOWF_10555 [Chloroflexota bacterium]
MQVRRIAAVLALAALVSGSAAPVAFAQGQDGDTSSSAASSGVSGGNVSTGDYSMSPDQPTTVAVGGDSNTLVPQPDLGRVPANRSDGVFNVMTLPEAPDGFDAAAAADEAAVSGDGSGEAAAEGDGEAVYVPTCADYGSWYDAQVALEESGDPALAESLDPDYNGVACDDMQG